MKDAINKLDNFVFHDVPVEKISFKTIKTSEFCVEIAFYNEDNKDYSHWKLIFKEVQKLNSNSLLLNSESDIEIYSFDYKKKELYECKIIFLLGFSQPSLVVEIICKDLDFIEKNKRNEKHS